jgi:Tol biopolymer transport system component
MTLRRGLFWRIPAVLCAVAFLALPARAQTGGFGQNKVTYETFDWKVYPSPHFDVHYYGQEEIFLEEVVSYAESAYLKISKALDHELRFRVPLVIYKTHADFEQTNITLEELPEAVGAFAEPFQNRMILPIDLPPRELYELIAHELTHIFQFSIFYEGYLGRALRSQAPQWLMEGMASYMAEDESNVDRMALRDLVVNGILPPIEGLSGLGFYTYRYGHAVFDFIEHQHGKEGVRTFIYEFRKVLLTGNIDKAIKDSLGYDAKEFNRRFAHYLQSRYLPVLLQKKAAEDYGVDIGIQEPGVHTLSPAVSPSGELLAVLSVPKDELDLFILSAEDGDKVRNLTKGWSNKWRDIVTRIFQGRRDISWSPMGDEVAVFVRRENRWPLVIHDALRGRIVRQNDLVGYSQTASPAFSPDGKRIAFEANKDGIVDLFELDLESGSVRNLTQDDYFDANPWYAPDGKTLVYNREVGQAWKIFSVDLSDASLKTQWTFGDSSDIQPSYSRDGKRVFFSSDRGPDGIFNIHSIELASGEVTQHTDVVGGCFAPVEMAERDGQPQLVFVAYSATVFRTFRMPLRRESTTPGTAPGSPAVPGSSSPADSGGPPNAGERATGPPPGSLPAPATGPTPVGEGGTATEQPPGPPAAPPTNLEGGTFEPPLRLTVDEEKKRPYKTKWDIESPAISVGVANDGTFLSNVGIQFSDLLGDKRIQLYVQTVSSYSNILLNYVNLRKRMHWGASVFDYRDYFVTQTSAGLSQDQTQRSTGVTTYMQYPFSRYYRVEGSVGYLDREQDTVVQNGPFFQFVPVKDRFGLVSASLTGDTTRFMAFGPSSGGPFQGKRFSVGVTYGKDAGSDFPGDLLEYNLDARFYKQFTRRSLLAWRVAAVIGAGERESYYSLGGINQLRGFEFREYFGPRVAWSNLELRFPLVEELRFPFGAFTSIRGFLFMDAGAAWFSDGTFFDPHGEFTQFRTAPKFSFWDEDNSRLQDGRASYGIGFQFFFAGLQLNWSWARQFPYTRYQQSLDLSDPLRPAVNFTPVEVDPRGSRMDFYIVYDF